VNLGHGGRGDGAGRELGKDLFDGPAQIFGDGSRHGLEGEGPDIVLQVGQGLGDVLGHQIGPRAHDLADFDEGGAQVPE
jgi:hypothetical protein